MMVMFQNSTPNGKELHAIRIHEGIPFIRIEGDWVSWEELKTKLAYDEALEKALSSHAWTENIRAYSPPFLVPRSRGEKNRLPLHFVRKFSVLQFSVLH